jgi:hypothetical protein
MRTLGGWPRSRGQIVQLTVPPVSRVWRPGMTFRFRPQEFNRQALALEVSDHGASKPLIVGLLPHHSPISPLCRKFPHPGAQSRYASWDTTADGSGSWFSIALSLLPVFQKIDCATVLLASPCDAIACRQIRVLAQKLCNCARSTLSLKIGSADPTLNASARLGWGTRARDRGHPSIC